MIRCITNGKLGMGCEVPERVARRGTEMAHEEVAGKRQAVVGNSLKVEKAMGGGHGEVDALRVGDIVIVRKGKLLKFAEIKDEWNVDVEDPDVLLSSIRKSALKADIFTFMQRLPESRPKYGYYMEWDNVAAIAIKTFDHWWRKQINDKVRNRARRAEKKGVAIKLVDFSDELVEGIKGIFNETPIRQGKRFSHYGEDFDTIKRDWSESIDRANFIGAYYNGELIGFIKLISAGRYTRTSGTVSKIAHRDKSPMNALIAKAVEFCAEKKSPYLVYGKMVYGKKGSDALSDFKLANGFEKIDLPRYYIPVTIKGKVALKLGLHHGVIQILPRQILGFLLNVRKKWLTKGQSEEVQTN